MRDAYYIGIDLGGSNIRAVAADYCGFIGRTHEEVKKNGQQLPETAVPKQADSLIRRLQEEYDLPRQGLQAIGISTCSPFRQGRIIEAPNLCGGLYKGSGIGNSWKGIPMLDVMERLYPGLTICMGNDCVTAAAAELNFGAGKQYKDFFYITWSTGIGGGAVLDGKIMPGGKNGNGPHVGHQLMNPQSKYHCGAGHRGCLEALASGTGIYNQVADLMRSSDAYRKMITDFIDADRKPGESGESAATRAIFDIARSNHYSEADGIVGKAAFYFGKGLLNLAVINDAEAFVVGGSITKDWDYVEPMVRDSFFDPSYDVFTQGVEIFRTELPIGDLAALSLVLPKDLVAHWQKTEPWAEFMQRESQKTKDS